MFLQCNNNEIRPGKHIGVCISVANNRLFVGSIPKSKTKEQIVEEFAKVTGESAPSFGPSFCIISCVKCIHNVHPNILTLLMKESVDEAFSVCVQMMTFYI